MNEPDISQAVFDPSSLPGTFPAGSVARDALDDPRVVEVVGEYLERLERGLAPDRGEYLRRYPELAGPIAQCLEALELVRAAAPRATAAADRAGAIGHVSEQA